MLERGKGNHTFNDSLYELCRLGHISYETTLSASFRQDEFLRRVENGKMMGSLLPADSCMKPHMNAEGYRLNDHLMLYLEK